MCAMAPPPTSDAIMLGGEGWESECAVGRWACRVGAGTRSLVAQASWLRGGHASTFVRQILGRAEAAGGRGRPVEHAHLPCSSALGDKSLERPIKAYLIRILQTSTPRF